MVVFDTNYVMVSRFFKIILFVVLYGSGAISGTVFAGSAGSGTALQAGSGVALQAGSGVALQAGSGAALYAGADVVSRGGTGNVLIAGPNVALHNGIDFEEGIATDTFSGDGTDMNPTDASGFGGEMMPVQPCGEVDPDADLDPDAMPDCGDIGFDESNTTAIYGTGNTACLVFLLVPFALVLAVIIFKKYREPSH